MRITMKGRAFIDAIETGLCPKVKGGYDTDTFEKFWERFGKEINMLEANLAREKECRKFWQRKFIQAMIFFTLCQTLLLIASIL